VKYLGLQLKTLWIWFRVSYLGSLFDSPCLRWCFYQPRRYYCTVIPFGKRETSLCKIMQDVWDGARNNPRRIIHHF